MSEKEGTDPIESALGSAAPRDWAEIRRTCPVRPLGYRKDPSGTLYSYQSADGSVIALEPRQHTRPELSALFAGKTKWLRENFEPEKNERGGWALEYARNWLFQECERAGRFDVETDLRGPGVWRLEYDGKREPDDPLLVVHVGDKMWLPTPAQAQRGYKRMPVWSDLGRVKSHVYVAANPEMRPGDKPATKQQMGELLELLRTWNWQRKTIDPELLIGAIGAATIVGALDWRPSICITGDKATGKSTLQQDLIYGGLLSSVLLFLSDTTEAALRQLLKGAARPVALDEFEAKKGEDTRLEAIIDLLRKSSRRGGGRVARWGKGGSASLFAIETMLFLSAINPPPLSSQDMDRVAVLELGPLQKFSGDRIGPRIEKVRALGPALRRRMVDGWDRFEIMLDQFAHALAAKGHGNRGCDQYGTLLACAWVLLQDGIAESADELAPWVEQLSAADLAAAADELPDSERCKLKLLSTASPDSWVGGHRRPVAELLRVAFGLAPAGSASPAQDAPTSFQIEEAAKDLGRIGLRAMRREETNGFGWLAVSNGHDALMRIFADSHWKGGGWARAMLRLPGAVRSPNTIRFGDVVTRAVLVPLDALGFELPKPKEEAEKA